ncbi:MAG: aminodeoxychorismate lyase [Verrucomicrobiae bacterium]|nr:aminodeoxychorismate lyase [Verrucomicrobiae bacterium]
MNPPPDSDAEVWINGTWRRPSEATISVLDRGFLYGDGLFETVRVHRGCLVRWSGHLQRLKAGARFLDIEIPHPDEQLTAVAVELVRRRGVPDGIVRLALSRGVGLRGYSPRGASRPTVVLTHHPAEPLDVDPPRTWRLSTSPYRIPEQDPLAPFKTANKLLQVLARAGAERAGFDEALLLNTRGDVVEATSGNLFWIEGDTLGTPPLSSGALPGLTRRWVLELAGSLGISAREEAVKPGRLTRADGVFLTLSALGIVGVGRLDNQPLPASPLLQRLRHAYIAAVNAATPS